MRYPSPSGPVCVFEHDEGHRVPRQQAALTAAFFQRHARPAPPLPPRPLRVELIQTARVWDAAPHRAFTDLCIDDDQFVLTFREGDGHAYGKDGVVRVLRSPDGSSWETMDVLELAGVDLRDPKVSRMPSGELHLLMGGSIYDGRKFVSRTTKVTRFDRRRGDSQAIVDAAVPAEVADLDDWIWRVCWHEGAAYGAMYQPAEGEVHLMRSPDGQRFEHVVQWRQDGLSLIHI